VKEAGILDSIKKRKKDNKNRKRTIIIILAVLLILTGIIIAVYPFVMQKIFDNRLQNLMDEWSSRIDIAEPPSILDYEADESGVDSDEIFEEDINAFFDYDYALSRMSGILKIPRINLTSPILVGDTKENLNIGVCEVKGSVRAGEAGNYILAGHYSRVYGRHLNRIWEIRIGTSVFVETNTGIYEYIVYEILQVKAEDTWAVPINIQDDENISIITLITCDYSTGEPYGRIVVKGWLKE